MIQAAARLVLGAAMILAASGAGRAGAEPERAAGEPGRVAFDESGYMVRQAPCGPFHMHYSERTSRISREVEKLICESAGDIAAEIGLEKPGMIHVYTVPDRNEFNSLSGGAIHEWGEAYSDLGRMMMGIDAGAVLRSPRPLKVVVRHELSHLFFSQKVRGARCPAWFMEGLAMRQSREWTLVDQWNLVASIWSGRLPDLEDLGGAFPRPIAEASSAYRLSYAAVDELFGENPGDLVTLISFVRETGDFDRAFLLTFGRAPEDFTAAFHMKLEKRYRTAGAVLHSSPFWIFVVLLFLSAYALKRIRGRRKLKEWREEGLD